MVDYKVNEEIEVPEVRLIDADGNQAGIIATGIAMKMAQQSQLDLVMITAAATPPVCKILDYGKFMYTQSRAEKERKRQSRLHEVEVKELRLRPTTGTHDIEIKAKKAVEFLDEGDRVLLRMKFRGREAAFVAEGRELMNLLIAKLGEVKLEKQEMMGRELVQIVSRVKKEKDAK